MKYTFKKAEKSTVKFEIKLTAEEWKKAIDEAYEKTKGRYSLPGFRKGKVPKHLLEQTYGAGIFYEEAIDIAFPKYFGEVLDKEKDLEIVSRPDVAIKDVSEKGVVFTAECAVKPDVTLGDYKGIKFDKIEYNVKDEDVEEELKRLQERNSRLIDVTDRAVEDGDTVVIDYSGSVGGVKFEGGTVEKQTLVIGSKTFIPGFEEQVIGMKIGEDRDINVKFPDDYHAENLKGKDSVFAIKLHEIKKKELPEINDEFIKDATGAESVDAYKKETRERLEKMNKDRADRETEDAIVKKITESATVEIPDALIDNQIDRMIQETEYRLSYQGLKFADYLKYVGQTEEDFRKGCREHAEQTVKSQLVIQKVIEQEKIEATEEDVENRVAEMAKAQNRPVPDVKKNMGARQLDYIKDEIVIKKLFDFLKNANTIA